MRPEGRWIRHACAAPTLPIPTLPVSVIQASGFAALIAGIGGAVLLEARPGPTVGPAIALAAITMVADQEGSLAIRTAAANLQQEDRFSRARFRHALPLQALDNSRPFLSP